MAATKNHFDIWNVLTFIQYKKCISEKVKYCKNFELFEDHTVQLKLLTVCSNIHERGQFKYTYIL